MLTRRINDWKEDYITILQERRLEKVKVETEKLSKVLLSIKAAKHRRYIRMKRPKQNIRQVWKYILKR